MGLYYLSTAGQVWIPSSIPLVSVQQAPSNNSATGIMCLVGEASQGQSFSEDPNFPSSCTFGSTQLSQVQAKFGLNSNLTAAYANAVVPSTDPAIPSAPNVIVLVKTNSGDASDYTLIVPGVNSNYSVLFDDNWSGTAGNNIYGQILNYQVEEAPTTGSFSYLPNFSTGSTLGWRIDGGAVVTQSISSNLAPDTLMNDINADFSLSSANAGTTSVGLLATGGVSSFAAITNGLSGSIETSLSYTSNTITISLSSGSWAVTPTAGMVLTISSSSGLVGAGSVNEGSYLVISATSGSVSANRIAANNSSSSYANVPAGSGTALSTNPPPFNIYTVENLQLAGGVNRGVIAGLSSPSVSGTVVSGIMTVTLNQNWAVQPQVNDWLWMSLGHATSDGWYTVTASTATTVTLSLVGLLNVDDTLSSFTSTSATTSDFAVLTPYVIGIGKALELQDGGGSANISTNFFTTAGAAAPWISTTASRVIEVSSQENAVSVDLNNSVTGVSNSIPDIGGNVVLIVSYVGTTATLTVNATNGVPTSITTSVSGGVGSNLNVSLTNFSTLNAVAQYINAQPGYAAAVASTLYGQYPSTSLDIVSGVGICSTSNNPSSGLNGPGRLKADAWAFFNAISTQSTLVAETDSANVVAGSYTPVRAAAGLPDPTSVFFLSGGTVGGTSNANVAAALAAVQNVTCNAVVPLFSQDATLDIAAGLTDPSSTYQIASINAATEAHVIAMSTALLKKNRQGYLSYRNTYLNVKEEAGTLANYRCSLCFQDVKTLNALGSLVQYQPWMLATLAGAMQMAGFYKSITNKLINCSGVVQAAGDWSDQNYSQVSDAIANGLLVAQTSVTGGIKWVADQTTYGVDNNFVYNRVQTVYLADIAALTIAQNMQDAFVGQAAADANASVALAYLAGIMNNLKRLKVTVATDSAPAGYMNASVQIVGPVMQVSLQIALDGAIYFIPININIVQPQQSAS